jgi:subtilisin family serine protease
VGKNLRRASFSEYGPQVDIAAPGEDMVHACGGNTGLCKTSGSSDAAALASASAALIWSKYLTWSNNQVLRVMLNTIGAPTDGGRFPVASDAAGMIIGDIQESVVDHYTRDSSGEAAQERDKFLEQQRSRSADAVYDATYTAAREAGIDHTNADSQANSASGEVRDSYGQGRQRAGS